MFGKNDSQKHKQGKLLLSTNFQYIKLRLYGPIEETNFFDNTENSYKVPKFAKDN